MSVSICFVSGTTFASKVLEFFLFSKFSHTGLVIDGEVYEARFCGGVQKTPYHQFRRHYGGHFEEYGLDLTNEQKLKLKSFSVEQLGKGYDVMGVFAFPFRRNSWQSQGKWFCSEYNAAALARAGVISIKQRFSRVSPRDLWILVSNRI